MSDLDKLAFKLHHGNSNLKIGVTAHLGYEFKDGVWIVDNYEDAPNTSLGQTWTGRGFTHTEAVLDWLKNRLTKDCNGPASIKP